jgi:two-component system sensor histidine kinase MtrB
VEQLSTGRLGAQIPVVDGGEFGDLASLFNTMSRDLRNERDELLAMEERSRRFTADVSHELRTPLAAMAAVAGVLEADAEQLPHETAEAALLVAQETRNLARLVEDLIEISRFDAGTAQLRHDEIDLAHLVQRTLAIRDWSHRVAMDAPPGLRVSVDARRVDVILANLVGNAVRYAGPDATISIRARLAGDQIRIDVSDNGDGIPVSDRARVFDRFVKGDPTRARSDGSGLGLSIAARTRCFMVVRSTSQTRPRAARPSFSVSPTPVYRPAPQGSPVQPRASVRLRGGRTPKGRDGCLGPSGAG